MNIKEYLKSSSFKGVLIGLSIALFLLIIFQLGVMVGYKRSMFTGRMGNSFHRNFVDPNSKFGMFNENFKREDMPVAHGAVGKVVSVNENGFVVADAENVEKNILVNEETVFRKFRDEIKFTDLQIGDFVVVFGPQNEQGEIEAKLVRNTPEAPMGAGMKNGGKFKR